MSSNLQNLSQEQNYKLLIRKLRKMKEKADIEKADNKKTDSNQSK